MTTIPEDVQTACEQDVSFIEQEIVRLHQLQTSSNSFEAIFGTGVNGILELSATLKHPHNEQECRCGRAALKRFRAIAERLIQARIDAPDWNISTLDDQLRATFLGFMTNENFEDSKGATFAWLQDSVRRVRTRHRKSTHYIPCVALRLGSESSHTFGSVTFLDKSSFFKTHEAGIDSYERARERLSTRAFRNATPSQQECLQNIKGQKRTGATEAFRKFTEGFPWIAVVEVPRCDHSVAEKRADEAVRIALSATKLLLQGSEGAGLRAPDDPVPFNTRQRLSSLDGKMFRTTGSWQFGTPTATTEWSSYIESAAAPVLAVCEELIQQALNGNCRPFAYQIALRAISWYSDAISDVNDETKLIKCVTALECLVLPADRAATASFSIRGALLAQRDELSFEDCVPVAKSLYARRSDIAHGNVEALNAAPAVLTKDALDFVRRATLQFLVFCKQLKPFGLRREGTKEDILELYKRIQESYAARIKTVVAENRWDKPWNTMTRQK